MWQQCSFNFDLCYKHKGSKKTWFSLQKQRSLIFNITVTFKPVHRFVYLPNDKIVKLITFTRTAHFLHCSVLSSYIRGKRYMCVIIGMVGFKIWLESCVNNIWLWISRRIQFDFENIPKLVPKYLHCIASKILHP